MFKIKNNRIIQYTAKIKEIYLKTPLFMSLCIVAGCTVSIHLFIIAASNAVAKPKQIATIDVPDIISTFIMQNNKKNLAPEATDKIVSDFSKRLSITVDNLASQENLILMPKQAVIAGSIDVTKRIKQQLLNNQGNN